MKRRSKDAILVSKILESILEKVQKGDLKPTISDVFRALQFKKEIQDKDEQPTEIKVSWVEPEETGHATGA